MASGKSDVCRSGEWSFSCRPILRASHTWVVESRALLGYEWTLLSSRKFASPSDSDVCWVLSLEVEYPKNNEGPVKLVKPETIRVCLSFITNISHKRVFFSALLRAQEQALSKDVDDSLEQLLSDDTSKMTRADAATRMSLGELFLMEFDRELTIRVDLVYLPQIQDAESSPAGLSLKVPPCTLCNDFGALLDNPCFSDVVLSADGHEWHVHKAILGARSRVFAAMFEHNMTEKKTNRVEVLDVNADVLQQVLRYIYTGKVDEIKMLGAEILAVADKYALRRLKTLCEQELSTTVDASNALEILVTADLHSAHELREVALQSLCSNIHQVLRSSAWQEVALAHPHLVHQVLAKCVNYHGTKLNTCI